MSTKEDVEFDVVHGKGLNFESPAGQVADSKNLQTMAYFFRVKEDYKQSSQCQARVLLIRETFLGPIHTYTLITQLDLAIESALAGDYKNSISYCEDFMLSAKAAKKAGQFGNLDTSHLSNKNLNWTISSELLDQVSSSSRQQQSDTTHLKQSEFNKSSQEKRDEGNVKEAKTNIEHPGCLIAKEVEKAGLSVAEAASKLGMTRNQLHRIIRGDSDISQQTALQLEANGYGLSAREWLIQQIDFNLSKHEAGDSIRVGRPSAKNSRPAAALRR